MIMSENRILLIENPAHLSIDIGRLKVARRGESPAFVAPRDIAVLVLHHPAITMTHSVMVELAGTGAILLSTDQKHMPCAMQLPLMASLQSVSRLERQIAARDTKVPGELWRQLVVSRLLGQAMLLKDKERSGVKLIERMASKVESGDPHNMESQAARHFWRHWLDAPKKRVKQNAQDGFNQSLNFGYAILRSCIARSVVASGLHPALGIHHANKENPFNLVDDLLEPFRYLVEERVASQLLGTEFGPEAKRVIASVVGATVHMSGMDYRLPAAIQATVSSYVNVLDGRKAVLALPTF